MLGVCVGMQMLARSSEEGRAPGLGWIDGHVRRFKPTEQDELVSPAHGMERRAPRIAPARCSISSSPTHAFIFCTRITSNATRQEDVAASTTYGVDFSLRSQRRERLRGAVPS